MSTTAKTLRPFDTTDFAMFAGVETANPLIEFENECAVVVDGIRLEVATNDGETYSMEYPSPATAEAVGNAILAALAEGDHRLVIERFALAFIC